MNAVVDKVSKQKDAVAKLTGAKEAMQLSLDRIRELESVLKGVVSCHDEIIKKAGEVGVPVWHERSTQYRSIGTVLSEQNLAIARVLG